MCDASHLNAINYNYKMKKSKLNERRPIFKSVCTADQRARLILQFHIHVQSNPSGMYIVYTFLTHFQIRVRTDVHFAALSYFCPIHRSFESDIVLALTFTFFRSNSASFPPPVTQTETASRDALASRAQKISEYQLRPSKEYTNTSSQSFA